MFKRKTHYLLLPIQFLIICASPPLAAAPARIPYADRDLNLAEAAELTGPGGLTIAIIDTGVDPNHPELSGAIDPQSYDFVKRTATLTDDNGHGTHVAGIIHRLVPKAKLMILRFYSSHLPATDTIHLTALAVRHAVTHGAQIINYSGGGPTASQEEFAAFSEAERKGVLVVAAAGNESANTDRQPYYPADYPIGNMLSVAAYGPSLTLIPCSNWGRSSVDLAAPGEDILSSLPGNRSGKMTGTSQATAFATAVAAMTWIKFPALRSPHRLIDHLKSTGRWDLHHQAKTGSGSRLNAMGALGQANRDMSPDFKYLFDGNLEFTDQDKSAPSSTARRPSSPMDTLELARRLSEKFPRRPAIQSP